MGKTKISDVIVPEVFTPYVIERTAELSRLIKSGIAVRNDEFDKLLNGGGKTFNMPFWTDLDGEDEVLSDGKALTPEKISAKDMVAVRLLRGKAWSANQLAKILAGDDPMKAIADLVAGYWSRKEQSTLIAILNGIFNGALKDTHVLDISSNATDNKISAEGIIDAEHLLGDAYGKFTAIAMHNASYAVLRKANLIDFIPDSQGIANIPVYLGLEVIVDDGCPVDTTNKVYTSYLFAKGSIGYGVGNIDDATETDRDSLAGDDFLINRRNFLLHPKGMSWKGTIADSSPSNTELATSDSWEKAYTDKNIPIVKFVHKV